MSPIGYATILVAPRHDQATSFVQPVSRQAFRVLSRLRVPVRTYFGPLIGIEKLWIDLAIEKRKGVQFLLGVLVAHGRSDEKGLSEADDRILFDHCTARQLQGAIIVLCSCLKSGDFAHRIVQPSVGIRSVIGYENELRILPSVFFSRWRFWQYIWPWSWYHRYQQAFANAVLVPIEALVSQNCSVKEAVEMGRAAWIALIADSSFDPRVRHAIAKNAKNLRWWPPESQDERLMFPTLS